MVRAIAGEVQDRLALERYSAAVTPDLRQLRYFLAVAEELNFTRAAERLHMAQPPLSAAIRQMEDQLGVELFERTSREVKLTAAGRLLAQRGPELLSDAERLFAAVRETEHAPVGRLALGVAPPARFGIGPQLLGACASKAPGVMLYTREDTTGVLLRELRAGRLDLVLGFCAPGDDALERERLRDQPAVVHVDASHPLAARESVALTDLREETFIVAGGPGAPGHTAPAVPPLRAARVGPR